MSKQGQLKIETGEGWFSAEFSQCDRSRYEGNVYPIVEWWHAGTGESGWAYCSKSSGGETHNSLNDDCRVMFEFSFCWRGVWEGRIYFKDEEYWSEELAAMTAVWDAIQSPLKSAIRKNFPDQILED